MGEIFYEERAIAMVSVKLTAEASQRRDKLVAENKCLTCHHKHAAGEPVRRGLCDRCYQAFRRAVRQKKADERRLIREGLVLPPGQGGRPPANAFTRAISELD